ncbi:MAG: hypothetical protein DME80_07390, partial [Verrucomicrobia bacterium]
RSDNNLIKVIGSRDLRIIEIQRGQARGTSEIPEPSSGMETISGTQTIIFVVTGRDMSSPVVRAIGIAIGTVTAITGGMVTDAPSSTDRG